MVSQNRPMNYQVMLRSEVHMYTNISKYFDLSTILMVAIFSHEWMQHQGSSGWSQKVQFQAIQMAFKAVLMKPIGMY